MVSLLLLKALVTRPSQWHLRAGEAFAANEAAGVEETLLSVFARGCDEDETSLGAGGDASFTLGGIQRAQYPLIKEYGLNYIGLHIMI